MRSRQEVIQSIKSDPKTTVLIIGAGINGIGVFRDLTLQGVKCLIVDRGDFCSGASMASSHMLHGGIRYLENGEFRLVREALHERNNLLRNAPHLTHPLPTTIPIFKWFSGILNAPLKFLGLLDQPAERGAVIIKLGLMLYDAYVRGDSPMPSHHIHNRQQALKKWPDFNPEILFAATYYDGAMNSPERLALEILADGIREGDHARALNYCNAAGSEGKALLLRDELTGEVLKIHPELVVNAGGPWIDLINKGIDGPTQYIGGTKGSHLIVDHPQLRKAIGDHEIFFEYLDGRIVLIFPYLENLVMIGSTDIRIEDPDQVACSEEEIQYILGIVPRIFPGLEVTREEIIFKFSGVRPLPVAKGATGQISRDHSIEYLEKSQRAPWPILCLVGGKWTSYRAFSEQVTDRVLEMLQVKRRAETSRLAIGGGRNFPPDESARQAWIRQTARTTGLSGERVGQLFSRYGTLAEEVAFSLGEKPEAFLNSVPGYSRQEIGYLSRNEMVAHLDDLLLRRTKLAWTGKLTGGAVEEIAGAVGQYLGWSPASQQEESERAIHILRDKHGVRI
jgi:glycerol-3-phosphate dehydrogenase